MIEIELTSPDETADLHAAVRALVNPNRVKVMRDVGPADWATLPSLLSQLQDAVASNATVKERRGSGGGSPVDWDAVDLLDRIRITAYDWAGYAILRPGQPLTATLTSLARHAWPPGGAETTLTRILTNLATQARRHLSPDGSTIRYVRAHCPECDYRLLTVPNEYGEPSVGFALVMEFHKGWANSLWCQVCWSYWTRQHLQDWALAILAPPEAVDVLETAGQPV